MSYQPRIGVVRDTPVCFRLAPHELDMIDQARGSAPRSSYLRSLIQHDLNERGITRE